MKKYDSAEDTIIHINKVNELGHQITNNIGNRIVIHDDSKLKSPEKEIFDIFTPKLKETTYESDEYKTYLKEMKVALDHHYYENKHHPEHYNDGISGMSLLDIIEMLIDWKAATLRHNDGNILRSIELNQERFNYTDELKQIFINTIKEMKWE